MTILQTKDIEKFQQLYKKHFEEEISKEEAYEKGARLVQLMQIIYKPMTKVEYDFTQKRQKELF